ncbi:hypothetical protein [Streptomyces oceani]|uniref:DUF4333 domain-containing protein n=1 Tax=Streptomyces oceani TaxID=1075402 RepID=A0A1E7KLG5_9ACTN|nr:hypothetical protein [Streptomyces oceani]OEV04785.1 hypothetical protein AN216_05800 [Streptomyces oceani]
MRRLKIPMLVMAAALLAAGCGSDDDSTEQSGDDGNSSQEQEKNQQKPEPKTLAMELTGPQKGVVESSEDLKMPPEPDNSAEFTEKVEHKLQEKLLRSAMTNGETSADCPDGITMKASATSECTASYEGAKVPFEVTLSEDYKEGAFLIQYDAEPQKALIVAKRVYHDFWEQKGKGGAPYEQKVSCDKIPAAEAVNVDAATSHQCQVWSEVGGEDGEGRVTPFAVWPGAYGPDFKPQGS